MKKKIGALISLLQISLFYYTFVQQLALEY